METFRFQPGETPVLLSMPHVGTTIPPDIAETMTDVALSVPDTDWHLDRLYHFAPALGIGFLKPVVSRYVVDLNRDPAGGSEPGSPVKTEVCPTHTFDGHPVRRDGVPPDGEEVARRVAAFWRPYHEQLAGALAALKERFGVAVLVDAHSLRADMALRFEGRPVDLALGTRDGASAAADLTERVANVIRATQTRNEAVNGSVKGGYTVRAYGAPAEGVHALQIEANQATYMDAGSPGRFDPARAAALRPCLERLLATAVDWAWENATTGRRRRSLF